MALKREALLAAIAEQKRAIAEAQARVADEKASLDALERNLARLERDTGARISEPLRFATPPAPAPVTADEKVALFRRLFRGREDFFPRLWENTRTGKKGYSPACDNEWVRGVCEKPRIKCSDCPNRAFSPVTDEVIADHLRGRHVIGVYTAASSRDPQGPGATRRRNQQPRRLHREGQPVRLDRGIAGRAREEEEAA
jgi:hypothetical protein